MITLTEPPVTYIILQSPQTLSTAPTPTYSLLNLGTTTPTPTCIPSPPQAPMVTGHTTTTPNVHPTVFFLNTLPNPVTYSTPHSQCSTPSQTFPTPMLSYTVAQTPQPLVTMRAPIPTPKSYTQPPTPTSPPQQPNHWSTLPWRPVYKTKMCRGFLSGSCRYGEKCMFAHGESELVMLPETGQSETMSDGQKAAEQSLHRQLQAELEQKSKKAN
eukprot:PhF_6_TR6187/c2_g1_i2/m.9283